MENIISDVIRAEIKFNKKINKNLSEFIQQEIISASTCFALKNPKWKGQGFPEYLVNWFKK